MLTIFPHLQALSASSPFWGGEDTGYASNRALLFQQLPTAGLPLQFKEWSAFEGYVADMVKTGVVEGVHGIHRSEEHTSELQSRGHLVCRLLLEKKKK